jgi:hypothetical protein
MILTNNQKIIICILILLILVYLYYKNKKQQENFIGIDITPNKILFYKQLCKMFNINNIPLEITTSDINIELNNVVLRNSNLENYLIIQNNTMGILKVIDAENPSDMKVMFNHNLINDVSRFVFSPSGSIMGLSSDNKIVFQTDTQNDNFNTLSLNYFGNIVFSKEIKDASRQLIYDFNELITKFSVHNQENTNTHPYQLKNNLLENKFNSIKNNIINYYDDILNQIKIEFPNHNIVYDIRAYPDDINLNNIILINQNKQHYLIGNDNKLTILNLTLVNNDLLFNGITLGVINTDKLIYNTDGNIVALDKTNKKLWSSNTNMNTLTLNNIGQLVFENKQNTKSEKYYLYQLIDKIPTNIRENDNNLTVNLLQKNNDDINTKYFGTTMTEDNTIQKIKSQLINKINNTNDKISRLKSQLNNKNITSTQKKNIIQQINIISEQKQVYELKNNELKNSQLKNNINNDLEKRNNDIKNAILVKNAMNKVKISEQERKKIQQIHNDYVTKSEQDSEQESDDEGSFNDKYKILQEQIKIENKNKNKKLIKHKKIPKYHDSVELLKSCGKYKTNISDSGCDDIEMIVQIKRKN